MNDTTMTAALRAADPFAATSAATPLRSRDPRQLFDEITAGQVGSGSGQDAPGHRLPARRAGAWRRLPRVVSLAAAAGVVAVVAAAVLSPWSTTPAAAAEAIAAAQQTEAGSSGRVVGDIQIVASPDGDSDVPGGRSGITAGFTLLYSEGNFDLTTTDGNGASRLIGIGDARYIQQAGTPTFTRADSEQDRFLEDGFGIAAAGAGPDGLVALVEQTQDVTVTGIGDGVRRFRGTVGVPALAGQDELPPGASFFADPARLQGYPDTVAVTMDVSGGLLQRLELRMFGDTSAGRTDLTVTTTFSRLGSDQRITAPTAEQLQAEDGSCRINATGDGGFTESAGCRPLLAVIDDFRTQNPDNRCAQLDGGQAFLQCLEEAGETEVARAYRAYRLAFPPGLR